MTVYFARDLRAKSGPGPALSPPPPYYPIKIVLKWVTKIIPQEASVHQWIWSLLNVCVSSRYPRPVVEIMIILSVLFQVQNITKV